MHLTWPTWILMVCVVASLACVVAGATRAALAFARFSKHAKRTSDDAAAIVNSARLEANLASINQLSAGIEALVERARTALTSISVSLEELRLPQAMLALRAARAAVRLLISGR
jgi:hypothetical protein